MNVEVHAYVLIKYTHDKLCEANEALKSNAF